MMEFLKQEIEPLLRCIRIDEPTIGLDDLSAKTGKMTVSPLLKGFGITVGNSLRRVLLSSLPGAAAVSASVSCNGVQALHEFTVLPGVKEDLCELLLNVKSLIVKLRSETPKTVFIDAVGPTVITGGSIPADADLEIINPELTLATVSDGAEFHMEIRFDHGIGYVPAEQNKKKYGGRIGELFVDSVFTPVTHVGYEVGESRVGSSLNYDRLEMNVETNGSLKPSEAIIIGAQILKAHFGMFTALAGINGEENKLVAKSREAQEQELLQTSIDDLELSVRSYNCLKRAGIDTVGDLAARSHTDLQKVRNLGLKSLVEIEEKLRGLGLKLKDEEE